MTYVTKIVQSDQTQLCNKAEAEMPTQPSQPSPLVARTCLFYPNIVASFHVLHVCLLFFNLLLHLLIEVEALGVPGSLVAALLERTYSVCLRPLHRVANFGMPSAHMHCVVRAAECVSFCLSGTEEKVVKSGATRLGEQEG